PLNAQDLLKNRPDPEDFKGLPKDTIMGHVHLHVSELQKTDEFYTEGLGFEVILNFGGQALFMSSEKYHHHIAANIWNGLGAPAPEKERIGLDREERREGKKVGLGWRRCMIKASTEVLEMGR